MTNRRGFLGCLLAAATMPLIPVVVSSQPHEIEIAPSNGADDSYRIEKVLREMSKRGGGIVKLRAGAVYYADSPINFSHLENVWFLGNGSEIMVDMDKGPAFVVGDGNKWCVIKGHVFCHMTFPDAFDYPEYTTYKGFA